MSAAAPPLPPTILFGGTFDPPHRAHVAMASAAADALHARAILVVPAALNPQRQGGRPPASGEDRLAMARLAFRAEPRAEVLDVEIARGGPSFTIDTVRSLAAHEPLRLLIGSDQALNLPTWRRWEELVKRAPPAIVVRPPDRADDLADRLAVRLGEPLERCRAWILPISPVELSATHIRNQLRGQSSGGTGTDERDLDPAVLAYIRSHGLYVS